MKTEIFWKWFEENNEQLTMLDDQEEAVAKSLLDEMQKALESYCEGLTFEMGEQTPNGRTVTFSAEGDTDLFKYVTDLVEEAPDMDWWEFVAFKQPKGKGLKVMFDKYRFDTRKMYFTELENEESPDMVGLRVAMENPVEGDDDQLVGVYVTVEALIGEFDCATLIGYLDVCAIPNEPFKEGYKKMDDLPEFIEWFKNR
ncbi:MAG: hypothetical protein K5867_07350 [Bacteroidales bacterium]|nr:hypothetical protein [Bacteroidales bacterium]